MTETRALSAQKWGLRALMECATGILTVLTREILMSSNFSGAGLQWRAFELIIDQIIPLSNPSFYLTFTFLFIYLGSILGIMSPSVLRI